jgi:membrane protein YdbS with pleckstrin-like domain
MWVLPLLEVRHLVQVEVMEVVAVAAYLAVLPVYRFKRWRYC